MSAGQTPICYGSQVRAALSSIVVLSTVLALCGMGCSPATQIPVRSTTHTAPQPLSTCLAVMLPGKGDAGESYTENGVVERLQAAQPDLEVITVDAHFGYYRERNLLPRLDEDVVTPAKARGIETIWMMGTSMGGIGALLMAQEHSESFDGIILMAPYLGRKAVLKSIEEAGGLDAWTPPEDQSEWDVSLWVWLKGYTTGATRPPLYLAYGTQDRGAKAHQLLADALPEGRVFIAEGGHAWKVWKGLWSQMFVAVAPFCPSRAL